MITLWANSRHPARWLTLGVICALAAPFLCGCHSPLRRTKHHTKLSPMHSALKPRKPPAYFTEPPFFGYHATCWRHWPEGWVPCPDGCWNGIPIDAVNIEELPATDPSGDNDDEKAGDEQKDSSQANEEPMDDEANSPDDPMSSRDPASAGEGSALDTDRESPGGTLPEPSGFPPSRSENQGPPMPRPLDPDGGSEDTGSADDTPPSPAVDEVPSVPPRVPQKETLRRGLRKSRFQVTASPPTDSASPVANAEETVQRRAQRWFKLVTPRDDASPSKTRDSSDRKGMK